MLPVITCSSFFCPGIFVHNKPHFAFFAEPESNCLPRRKACIELHVALTRERPGERPGSAPTDRSHAIPSATT